MIPSTRIIRVLYAEDDPIDADLTRTHFQSEAPDLSLEIVATGSEFLDRVGRETFDALLIDQALPDMEGIDILKELRRRGVAVPAVMVTGTGNEELVIRSLRLGARQYVPKHGSYLADLPVVLRDVVSRCRAAMGRKGPGAPVARRVLYVEHNPMDTDMTRRAFEEEAPHLEFDVETRADAALERISSPGSVDLVLYDLHMPGLGGLEFLRELRARRIDVPVVLITGRGGEEAAVAALKLGAVDYIVKRDGYLLQLPYAVENALQRCALEREIAAHEETGSALRASDARLREIADTITEVFWTADATTGRVLYASPACERVWGLSMKDLDADPGVVFATIDPRDRERVVAAFGGLAADSVLEQEYRILRSGGTSRWVSNWAAAIREPGGRVVRYVGAAQDIDERKQAEMEKEGLFEIAKLIARVPDLDTLLTRVLERARSALACDRMAAFTWDAARAGYRTVAAVGIPADLAAEVDALEFRAGTEIVDALLAGRTLIGDGAGPGGGGPIPREIVERLRIGAFAIVPLIVHGKPVGAVAATRERGAGVIVARQLQVLEDVAQQLSIAVEAHDSARARREEAVVNAALARVGQELIAAQGTTALLNALCEVSVAAIECDFTHAWLWDPGKEVFSSAAGWGDSPEQEAARRVVSFDRTKLAPLLHHLATEGIETRVHSHPDLAGAAAAAFAGHTTVTMALPLWQAGEVMGFTVFGFRGRTKPFGPLQERIARGISHLASLALVNAQLTERLEVADRLKSDFVATMSHELRTPLNVILGYGELLLDDEFGPLQPEQADALRCMRKSATELFELVKAVLDLGRLDSGTPSLDLKDVDTGELLGRLRDEVNGRYVKSEVQLGFDVAPGLPPLHTDPVKLKLVLRNLIDNAMKFTLVGEVTVSAVGRGGGVEFAVADTGIGIAPDVLPTIFDPFRQGESAMTRAFGGVGLGLYIVRRQLELLGGTIVVESEVGRGTTFRVHLPRSGAGTTP